MINWECSKQFVGFLDHCSTIHLVVSAANPLSSQPTNLVEGVQLSFELRLQLEEGRALREVPDEEFDGGGDVLEADRGVDQADVVLLVQV